MPGPTSTARCRRRSSPTRRPRSTTPRRRTKNELGVACELAGHCEKYFTGPTTQRTGPIAITLPPGYAIEANRARNVRYPVLFILHGYGQDPRDLEATAAVTDNYRTIASAPRRPASRR